MREQEEGLEKEAEIQRLKVQRDHLVEKQQQLQQQVQRHSLYGDFLEEVVKMTKVLQVWEIISSFSSCTLRLYSRRHCIGAVDQNVNIFPKTLTNPPVGRGNECVCLCVQFEDARSFMAHVENLLHLRQQLSEKEEGSQKDVDQSKSVLQTLEDQHHLTSLHMNIQLSQLHRDMEEMCSETLTWVPVTSSSEE